jgi:hypothetical protein
MMISLVVGIVSAKETTAADPEKARLTSSAKAAGQSHTEGQQNAQKKTEVQQRAAQQTVPTVRVRVNLVPVQVVVRDGTGKILSETNPRRLNR